MAKDPREIEREDDDNQVDPNAREAIEQLDGYREYLREQRGNNLTFGNY